ncbi:hypothetical protein [Mesorhizobium ciceri]|uniref:Uncharacterized protein n=1 Tax=Mesorhizobium ciceri biovar biserrulae (strain HAMBI 2942 / LMG 23838 / WSM1271) TaxID=765698 RepID=E8T8S3_MESCW|nr:hypothetical protein [Mesorhizobium ciceri]ADV12971.1 hypothetical protein Mesci_3854 [Mesorhizobium ciceri biovar biserrulae WSM1271]
MVAENKALILWNVDDEPMVIHDLIVVNIDEQDARTENYLASGGACDEDWLDSKLQTPMGLFLYLSTYYGFKDRKVLRKAIYEFSKIDGDDWSKDLMSTMFDPTED